MASIIVKTDTHVVIMHPVILCAAMVSMRCAAVAYLEITVALKDIAAALADFVHK